MDYLLVRRLLIFMLRTLLMVVIIAGVTAESRPTCEPKSVLLDASGQYTIPYEVCVSSDPASKCQPTHDCDPSDCGGVPLGIGNITSVQFISDTCKGTIEHSKNTENFSVSLLREDFTGNGVYNCGIMYQYVSECYDFLGHECSCLGKVNLDLVVIVTDLELTVDTGDGQGPREETSVVVYMDGASSNKNISFKCGEVVRDSLDLTMNFELTTSNRSTSLVKTLPCPKYSDQTIVGENFVVTRHDNDCILTITDVSQEDNGNYSCNIFLPQSNSPYNSDWSNSISLVTEKSPVFDKETTLGLIATVFFAVVVFFIVVSVIAFVTNCAGVAIYNQTKSSKRRGNKKRIEDTERKNLIEEGSGSYGTVHSNLSSRPETPSSNASDTLLTNGRDGAGIGATGGPHEIVAEVETMLQISISPRGQRLEVTVPSGPQKGNTPQTGPTSGESNDSKDDYTRVWSDDQLLRRAMKDDTPPSSKPKTLRCKQCGKCYAEDRNQEFRFHVMENSCVPGRSTKTDKVDSMESKQGKSSPGSMQFPMDSSGDSS